MSEKFNGAVTAMGASLIAKAIANNTKMSFLKIIGSKSTYTDKQLPTLTDDVLSSASHDQEGHISNVTIADETTIKTELVLDGSSVEADYQLNTVLILATVDGTDHLFGALKANQPQYMNAYDGKSSTNLEINCSFKVANADAVSITVDTAGTLTVDDYNRLHAYTDAQVASASGVANKRMDSAVAVETKNRAAAVTSESTARSSAVAAEATARSNAVSDEASARAAADTKLQNSATANSAAIGKLQTSAATYTDTKVQSAATVASNATSTEAVNRTSAVAAESTARSNAVSAETAKRVAADSAESSARAAADTKLQTSATANATAAAKAQTTANNASSAVVNEATARTNADATINKTITTNDGKAVHKTGDETVAGTKTFSSPINGALATRPLPKNMAIADIAASQMLTMAGNWWVSAENVPTDTPSFALNWYTLTIVPSNSATTGYMILNYLPGDRQYITAVNNGKLAGNWKLIADDATVVHKTGGESISGKKMFSGELQLTGVNPLLGMNANGVGGIAALRGYAGTVSGMGLTVGAGGLTVLGGGEAAENYMKTVLAGTLPSQLTKHSTADSEVAVIASDGPVHLVSNMQDPTKAHEATFDTLGYLSVGGIRVRMAHANDVRSTNENPKWYLTNHSNDPAWPEFKSLSAVGITSAILPAGITATFGHMSTSTGFADGGAGWPEQEMRIFGKAGGWPVHLYRVGVSDTAWSKWYMAPLIERG